MTFQAAPVLWCSEFRNILAGRMYRSALNFEQGCAVEAEAQDLLTGVEYEVDSLHRLELVRDRDCSAYDCEWSRWRQGAV